MQVSGGRGGLHEKKAGDPVQYKLHPLPLCDLRVTFILGPACIKSEIKIYSGCS